MKINTKNCLRLFFILPLCLTVFTSCKKPVQSTEFSESIIGAITSEWEDKGEVVETEVAEKFLDFIIELPKGREKDDFKILQITDTQVMDSTQNMDKFGSQVRGVYAPEMVDNHVYKYIKDAIEKTKPDVIALTGDIVYGRYDDSGIQFQNLVNYIDSFEIPWCPVYGNHDNESARGVKWQNQVLLDARYCLFKKGGIKNSNGNYTVGIIRNGKVERVLYFMDSNGCSVASAQSVKDGVIKDVGLNSQHQNWLIKNAKSIYENFRRKIPAFAFYHIPTKDYYDVHILSGGGNLDLGFDYTQNWGVSAESISCSDIYFSETFNMVGIEASFVGHDHVNNFGVKYNGVEWVYGLKTGRYDYHPSKMGGTLIKVKGDAYSIENVYYDNFIGDYQKVYDAPHLFVSGNPSAVIENARVDGENAIRLYNNSSNMIEENSYFGVDLKGVDRDFFENEKSYISFSVYLNSLVDFKVVGYSSAGLNVTFNAEDLGIATTGKWVDVKIYLSQFEEPILLLEREGRVNYLGFKIAKGKEVYLKNLKISNV